MTDECRTVLTIEQKAKCAAEARAELAQALMNCGTALAQTSELLVSSCMAMHQAAEKEHMATSQYVAALECELSRQKQLS
jgi:hypothetical protein